MVRVEISELRQHPLYRISGANQRTNLTTDAGLVLGDQGNLSDHDQTLSRTDAQAIPATRAAPRINDRQLANRRASGVSRMVVGRLAYHSIQNSVFGHRYVV